MKDVPGFYVNRALGPFMAEVSALLADGADIQALDKALVQFGMPVGPITLADEVKKAAPCETVLRMVHW